MEEEGRRRNVFGVSRKPSDSFYTMHATVGCDQPVACNKISACAVNKENTIQRRVCWLFSVLFVHVNKFATPKLRVSRGQCCECMCCCSTGCYIVAVTADTVVVVPTTVRSSTMTC